MTKAVVNIGVSVCCWLYFHRALLGNGPEWDKLALVLMSVFALCMFALPESSDRSTLSAPRQQKPQCR